MDIFSFQYLTKFCNSFLLLFSFFLHHISGFTISDSSIRNQCKSGWHFLSEATICIIFATTEEGDVAWNGAYKACQSNSAQLLTLSDSREIQSIEKKLTDNQQYLNSIQRGTWIGKAKWFEDDLCDSTSTTIEDLQFNCMILIRRFNDQKLCLKRVSCRENHPFICQTPAMTKNELDESSMERVAWWHCIIPALCIMEAVALQTKQKIQTAADTAAKAAADAEIQKYKSQFDFDTHNQTVINAYQQVFMKSRDKTLALSDSGGPSWLTLIGEGLISLLMISMCCTALIYVYKKMNNGRSGHNSGERNGSIDSTDSS